jgi:hypothetical protein
MRKKTVKFDVATNGKEAVDKWRTGSFHLVLVRPYLHIDIFTFFYQLTHPMFSAYNNHD